MAEEPETPEPWWVARSRGPERPPAGREAKAAPRPGPERKDEPALEDQAQIDLDSDEGIRAAGLEDPDLVMHVGRMRQLQVQAPETPPKPRGAVEKDQEARRALSALNLGLSSLLGLLRLEAENVAADARSASKLVNGLQPHGYPEPSKGLPASVAHLGGRLESRGKALAGVAKAGEELLKHLTLARRAYEEAIADPPPAGPGAPPAAGTPAAGAI